MKSYLCHVRKPAQYLGNELHAVKDPAPKDLRVGLAFPDLYEIGMSNIGVSILYHILNSIPGIFAERVFAPDLDVEAILRSKGIPLTTLETDTPLKDLDILGFSLQYELTYTNILAILDLGGIPLHCSDRTSRDPLILGGGPCAFNPEPLSDFIDAFVIGDAEYRLPEICALYRDWKASGNPREELLRALDRIEGVYVPSFFTLLLSSSQSREHLMPLVSQKRPVRKCIVHDLDNAPFPESPIVPFLRIVHDRMNMEVARGCTHGCRFCQAGVTYHPVRERSPQKIYDSVVKSLQRTGYDEVSLLSLSIGDYSALPSLVERLMNHLSPRRIGLSLPSIRVGSLDPKIMNEILRVRKTGFTLAPEAASKRLQDVINKKIHEEEIIQTTRNLFGAGWRNVKLYFMIGLPTETEQDVEEIISLADRIRRATKRCRDGFKITVNVSTFVPKAHTPFQWQPQISKTQAEQKQDFLRQHLWQRSQFRFKWHDSRLSVLEGVFARGDRSLGTLLEKAYRLGCRLDGWSEYLKFDAWERAFEATGIDPDHYLRGPGLPEDPLPWDWIDTGIRREFLVQEHLNALQGVSTLFRCKGQCKECGICTPWKATLAPHSDQIWHVGQDADESSNVPTHRPSEQDRIRFRYAKRPPAVLLGHLETMAVFQRALRRSQLPLSFTMGLHPHLRMSFSQALAVGIESFCEYIDVVFDGDVDPIHASAMVNNQLPHGLQIVEAHSVPLHASSLEDCIDDVHYQILFREINEKEKLLEILSRSIEAFHSGLSSIIQIRKKQRDTFTDLRPYVKEFVVRQETFPQLSVVLRRWNESLISISRVLEALFSSDEVRAWPYSIRKVQMTFREHPSVPAMDCGHGK